MRPKSGNVRQLPSGRFGASYKTADGRMHVGRTPWGGSRTFATRRAAESWLAQGCESAPAAIPALPDQERDGSDWTKTVALPEPTIAAYALTEVGRNAQGHIMLGRRRPR